MLRVDEHTSLSSLGAGIVIRAPSGQEITLDEKEEQVAIKKAIEERIILKTNRDIATVQSMITGVGSAIGLAVGGALAALLIGLVVKEERKKK
jgi:hypothetical protein